MEQIKKCRTCEKLLDETLFSIIRTDKKTGIVYRRPDCKSCLGIKPKKQVPKNTPGVFENSVLKQDTKKYNTLTMEETSILRDIIKHFTITEINQDRKNRTPRTFNVDNDLMNRIKIFSDKNNMSISDSINLLISKSLDLFKS